MPDSEARKEDESEDETQFEVVWKRYEGQVKQVSDGDAEVDETQQIVAKSGKSAVIPEHWDCPFSSLIHETPAECAQSGDSDEDDVPLSQIIAQEKLKITETVTEMTVGQDSIGRKVAKRFEAGVFIGEVISVAGQRGRHLYKILYEDGDGEDMNEKEFLQACAMFRNKEDKANDDKEEGSTT